MELQKIRKLAQRLRAFVKDSRPGDRMKFIEKDELEKILGISEDLFMTKLKDAVLVHYGAEGDWTSALFIPLENFNVKIQQEIFGPIDEAIDWFLTYKN